MQQLRRRALLAVLLGAAAPGAVVSAEQGARPYRQACVYTPLPFVPAPASQVTELELRKLLTGRHVVMTRSIDVLTDGSRRGEQQLQRFGRPTHRRYSYDLRNDGSVRLHCDTLDGIAGPARPCPNVAFQDGALGPDEVGTWQIASHALCWTFSRFGEGREMCGAVHRHGGKYWYHLLRGSRRGCFEGEMEIK